MARQSIHNRRAGRGSTGGGASWISYSDMMAALLLIFVLILTYSLYQYFTMLETKTAELEEQQTLLMTTALGLAPVAYAVTGARALRTTSRMGTVLHIVGGSIGLAIMVLLVVLGALELLTPANMFLYQLVWMIPAILFTEWTRSI